MAGRQRTSKSQPAEPWWLHRGRLVHRLLERYGNDPCFSAALLAFSEKHLQFYERNPGVDWLQLAERAFRETRFGEASEFSTHKATVETFGRAFHLDAMGEGVLATVHDWCVKHHEHPDWYSPSSFSAGHHGFGGWSGYVDPTIAVHIETFWNIEGETYAAAVARIDALCKEQVRAALNRIKTESQSEHAGFVFGTAQPTDTEKHLDWLFERIAREKSCNDIAIRASLADDAPEDGIAESTVRKDTDRIADATGIKIPRPKSDM